MSYAKHNFQPGGTIQAAPFNAMEDQIALNESDIASLDERVQVLEAAPIGPSGISVALRSAILQLAEKVAYIDSSGQDCYQDLYNALYNNAHIVSISAVLDLDGHTVSAGDALDTLRPYLTVTALYDDESQREVSNYTLSGQIILGNNTITAAYEGETDTFTVYGNVPTTLPEGYTAISSLYCAGGKDLYLDPGVSTDDFDYAEYSIMPIGMSYRKAGVILTGTNCRFPYLTGDNTNGDQSRIGFNNMGSQESAVTSGSYLYSWNLNDRHTLKGYVDGKVFVDDVELFTVPAGSAANTALRLFNATDTTAHFYTGRLYWLRLYKNNVLCRNYLPCKNSNNVVGLYETALGNFVYDTTDSGLIREGGE